MRKLGLLLGFTRSMAVGRQGRIIWSIPPSPGQEQGHTRTIDESGKGSYRRRQDVVK